jgi:uncharacterized membrane protein YbhN (UPF0104 family)
VLLLAAVVWYVDPRALAASLAAVDPRWFAAGLAASIVSNVLSAARWAAIARGLGLAAQLAQATFMYFRGMTMNVLLPGATVSGDVLRSYQLANANQKQLLRAGLSVLLDRLSGLWILCAMSLASLLVGLAMGLIGWDPSIGVYITMLAFALAAPWIPLPFLDEKRRALLERRGPLIASAWLSVLVQVFSAAALWLFALALGVPLSYPAMLAAAAPIFIMGALPLGWGGFGAREAGAVVVLGVLGVAPGPATAIGLLYGISALLQGVAAAPLFLVRGGATPRS